MKRAVGHLGKIQSVAGPIFTRYHSVEDNMIITGHNFFERIPRFAFRQCHVIGHTTEPAITVRLVGAQIAFQYQIIFGIGVISLWQRQFEFAESVRRSARIVSQTSIAPSTGLPLASVT